MMDDVIVARALHVLAVVIWIGGVAMATTVALPAVRHGDLGSDKFQAFQAIEHRFAWQARTAIILVGLTGFYMTWRLDLWERFRTAGFWWMHAMVCLWLLSTDFGDTETGKITARYDFSPAFAIRGTISTGFRAPSVAEEFYSAVSVSAIAATVQLPADSAAAKILGLPNLKPESSTSFSAGVVAHVLDNLFATVDVYSLTLGNRIVSSSTVNSSGGAINTPLVTQAITLEGVTLDPTATQQGVAAFLNGVSTLSQGVDVTVSYLSDFDEYGSVRWTLGANYNNTSISSVVPPPAVLLASNPNASFFTFQTLYNYVHGAPQDKIGLTADWNMGVWGATLRETYWGPQHSYVSPNGGGELIPFNQPDIGLTDAEVRYSFTDDIELAVGGENLFDVGAEKLPYAPASCAGGGVIVLTTCSPGPDSPNGVALTASGSNVGHGPFGAPAFNPLGGYYYVRISYKL